MTRKSEEEKRLSSHVRYDIVMAFLKDCSSGMNCSPLALPVCRNGRRGRLKICCRQLRVGSSPTTGSLNIYGCPRRNISLRHGQPFFLFTVFLQDCCIPGSSQRWRNNPPLSPLSGSAERSRPPSAEVPMSAGGHYSYIPWKNHGLRCRG